MIPPGTLSSLFIFVEVLGVKMINSIEGLNPLINIFIKIVIVIGPLSIAGVILLLKRIEKESPERIRWK